MLFMARPDSKSVHALADLLETIEVAADELLDQKLAARDSAANGDAELETYLAGLRQFSNRVRGLELTIVAKLEQARARARNVARTDWRLRPIMAMFTSGTQGYANHLAAHNDRDAVRFNAGDQIFPFLRSRELVSPLSTHYDGGTELLVTDSYRLLGLIKLRDLLENCEAALNSLDAHYDLYDWQDDSDSVDEAEAAQIELRPEAVAAVPEAAAAELPVAAPAILQTADAAPGTAPAQEPAVVNWGDRLEPAAAVTVEAPAAPSEPVAPEQLEAARLESEQSLKSLTGRLADMKITAEPAKEPEAKDAAAA